MIDLWHSSVDLKPSHEAMIKVLESKKVTANAQNSKTLLKQGEYDCETNVMVDGDIFTYPYYWIPLQKDDIVCAVKILQPMTPIQNYFEYRITCPGAICAIAIGVVRSNYSLSRLPGWDEEGIGYHADDGRLYYQCQHSRERFGPTCTAGDRMGCGVDFESEDSSDYVKVFFTKNRVFCWYTFF